MANGDNGLCFRAKTENIMTKKQKDSETKAYTKKDSGRGLG